MAYITIARGILYFLSVAALITLFAWFFTQDKDYQYDYFYALVVSYCTLFVTGWFNTLIGMICLNSILISITVFWWFLHDNPRDYMYVGFGCYALLIILSSCAAPKECCSQNFKKYLRR